ncbi:hypothetical protein CXF48_10210 [Corynebacterium bovis]|uniref:Uncharacterized protein n=1 Tax=Corynebacterium bovis TaxID=36808 RepID=A0A426PWA0_9CORY|nr:hypothetical protein CXF48_10210 [Corynebacterium bovis]
MPPPHPPAPTPAPTPSPGPPSTPAPEPRQTPADPAPTPAPTPSPGRCRLPTPRTDPGQTKPSRPGRRSRGRVGQGRGPGAAWAAQPWRALKRGSRLLIT